MKEDYFEFILSQVEHFREEGRHSARRIWRSALHAFMEATKLKKLPVRLLSRRLLTLCKEWMLSRGMSRNTINVYLGALQAAYNRMTSGTKNHVYGLFKGLRTGSVSTVKRAVSQSDMARVMRTDPETLPSQLRKPFAWFTLMFLLRGMPFVDLAHLRKGDYRNGVITYQRQKTGRELVIQVPDEARTIIEKYASQCPESHYLLPILKEQASGLKETYTDYQRALRGFNLDLEKLSVALHIRVHLSSYTARHTWATIAYYQGVALGIISKALGHASVRMTEYYLKPFENKEVDKTNRQMIARLRKVFELDK